MTTEERKPLEQLARETGFDTPRIWANSVRVLNGPTDLILIFQEKLGVEGDGRFLERNLASVVVTKAVAKELAEIILRQDGIAVGE